MGLCLALFVTYLAIMVCVLTRGTAGRDAARALESSARHRVAAWRAAGRMLRRAPVLGLGLGAYGKAQPAFAKTPPVLYFAHNDYLQFAAEAGLVGLAAGACTLGWLCRRALRRRSNGPAAETPAGCRSDTFGPYWRIAALSALAAIAVHSFFDYNLHVPANAFLVAVCGGFLLGRRASPPPQAPGRMSSTRRVWLSRVARTPIALGIVCCLLAAVRDMAIERRLRPLRRALAAQRLPDSQLTRTRKRALLTDAHAPAERAGLLAPWNTEYAQLMARASLHLSAGRPGPELIRARQWLARSLRLCPLNRSDRTTMQAILDELSGAADSPTRSP